MALKAGYYGIKKFIADKLNRMNPGDSFATDAEIAAAVEKINNTIGFTNDNVISLVGATDNTLLYVDGTLVSNSGWKITDYLPILENVLYRLTLEGTGVLTSICFYDSEKQYISGIAYNSRSVITIKTPVNSAYCRVSINKEYPATVLAAISVNDLSNTKADITALGTEEGATASRLYHPGEYFYKDGKTYRVKGSADVPADSTWSSGNCEEKPLYDVQIKSATFSGTTSNIGALIVSTSATRHVLSAEVTGNVATLYKRAEGYGAVITTPQGEPISETAVSGTYYYID